MARILGEDRPAAAYTGSLSLPSQAAFSLSTPRAGNILSYFPKLELLGKPTVIKTKVLLM